MVLKIIETFHLHALHGVFLQVFLSFAVSLTTMSDGISVGWTSTKIAQLTDNTKNSTEKLSLEQASFIGTLPIYVYPLVLPIAIYSTNQLGRKWTIIWGAFLTFLSWLFVFFTDRIEYLYVGVLLRGIGGYILYTVPAMYIAEVAQANIRGFLGTFVPILMNLGILLSYICVAYTSLQNLALFGIITLAVMFIIFIFAPESPYFLCMKNKSEIARNSLQKFRSTKDIQNELDDIKTIVEKNSLEGGSVKEFFTDKVCRKVSVIVLAIQLFQQLSGIDAILLFLKVILDASGSSLPSNHSSIVFGAAKFTACAVSLILVDKVGRRPLLIFSCAVASLALAIMGVYYYLKDIMLYDISSVAWLPLVILILYVLGYNVGLGTIPFIIASEMYPTKFKALGTGAVQLMYCVSMVSVTEIFALIKDTYGFYLAFWFLSAMTVLGLVFSIYCVYETKGKTLKQILIELE